MVELPYNIVTILNRIAHYQKLMDEESSESQRLCYNLVIVELQMLLERIE